MKKIRVTETTVTEYVPDFSEEFYSSLNVTNIEEALKVDERSVKDKDISVDELGRMVSGTIVFEIVEVD